GPGSTSGAPAGRRASASTPSGWRRSPRRPGTRPPRRRRTPRPCSRRSSAGLLLARPPGHGILVGGLVAREEALLEGDPGLGVLRRTGVVALERLVALVV